MKNFRKTSVVLCLCLLVNLLLGMNLYTVSAVGTTYYVSYSAGNDSNNGTSQSTPWKTLGKVSSVTFNAGDTVCLKAGDSWSGEELLLKGNGTSAAPITLTSYGTGSRPVIMNPSADFDANLSVNQSPDPRTSIRVAVKLKNYVGWSINNLEIKNAEYGIICYNVTQTPMSPAVVNNCYVHDISGGRMWASTDSPYPLLQKSYGIVMYGYDATVTNCNIQHVTGALNMSCCPVINVADNYVYDATTEGLHFVSVVRGTVKNCQVLHTGYPSGVWHGVAAVLFGNVANVTIQDCEIGDVYDPLYDGVGIDFEGNNINVTALRCNFYDCDSSAIMIYNTGAAGNDNSVTRVINCRAVNCGRRNYSTLPAFIRNYGNASNRGVFAGNIIKRATATQKIYWIDVASPNLTDTPPATYSVQNNSYYSYTANIPGVSAAAADSWTASSGFSSTVNGANQWYYHYWNGVTMTPMTAGSLGWQGTLQNCLAGDNWQHPDTNQDSARTWIAPKAGVISISSLARMGSTGGDGVAVGIKKNNNWIYGPVNIDGSNTTGISINVSGVTVEAGDALHFLVNSRTTTYYDTTYWNPVITMTAKNSWNAQNDFSNAQGANQWYYHDTGAQTVYNAMQYDQANNRWFGNESMAIVGDNWQHPGTAYNSARTWIAPRDGTVSVTGTYHLWAAGDGVKLKIVKNGNSYWGGVFWGEETVLAERLVTSTTAQSFACSAAVKAGDILFFVVNKNGNNTNDTTYFNPTVTYQ